VAIVPGTQDQGTRGGSLNQTKAGIDDAQRLSEMLRVTDADGFFGGGGSPPFYAAGLTESDLRDACSCCEYIRRERPTGC
jgi:hypothetical protein